MPGHCPLNVMHRVGESGHHRDHEFGMGFFRDLSTVGESYWLLLLLWEGLFGQAAKRPNGNPPCECLWLNSP